MASLPLVLSLVSVVALPAAGAPVPVSCPVAPSFGKLTGVSVFDGPPSEMADLMPDEGGWTFDFAPSSKQGFFLSCKYAHHAAPVVIQLPMGVKRCRNTTAPQVVCR